MNYQVVSDLQTMLQTKSGQTFAEAMMKAQGKALLINFCTPFLEAYPKDKKHCAMIYDMARLDAAVVPESSIPDLAAYIQVGVGGLDRLVLTQLADATARHPSQLALLTCPPPCLLVCAALAHRCAAAHAIHGTPGRSGRQGNGRV